MKPFQLQIQLTTESGNLTVQWFGSSAIHAEGSRAFVPRTDTAAFSVADALLIDLNPLLAEIAAGAISDAEELQAADEFLWLKDLLTGDDFEALCDALFRFL